MDNDEFLLRTFEKIQLNNRITDLEYNINMKEKLNNMLSLKSKEMMMDLLNQKNNLEEKVNSLTLENTQLHNTINNIPGFILRFFTKKKTKLLN